MQHYFQYTCQNGLSGEWLKESTFTKVLHGHTLTTAIISPHCSSTERGVHHAIDLFNQSEKGSVEWRSWQVKK